MNGVINYMEVLVEEHMEILLKESNSCTCDRCKSDIFALALNNLKPYYVVTQRGRVMTKLQMTEQQFDTDITIEVTRAIEQVKNNPAHNVTIL
ncbi:late competence development ComFB family protein [Clostridium saccharobutylicum]|uniref:Late competence development protein ComFB n=1 Tax=Clostridium saccharobutylicum DSM 13864 TaxID=1345695 RepID=U5MS12_CLOSA|nr:late competence development ComFB family protein [Clostridium saccharobutylicum]AGX43589.1 late competence development protein ComFB [Clostridium saccharobutylicum DSM 13864]AQR90887.1 late competence development protein ComFB [Clostridium saccharobutylicum]AQS00791.1 late competence development protein ComFB [Clostridium saccharobutylicum]AQS10454.1 late competence development protein ComFB [Clostridium saccharobutylicum]AQS14774.1 late competence development protein ComFB [Clostridium sac